MAKRLDIRKKSEIEVVVELKGLNKEEGWPKLAVYLYGRTKRPLGRQSLKQDARSAATGRAHFAVAARKERFVVRIGPEMPDGSLPDFKQTVSGTVIAEPGAKVSRSFELDKKIWWCWLRLPYVVTGSVVKDAGDFNAPVCSGTVDIYDVDVSCILQLAPSVIEDIREGIIDLVLDPPRIEIPESWGSWEDDDYCGTVPRPPFPPRGFDIRKKLDELPPAWSFASKRYDALKGAAKRMDGHLSGMELRTRQSFLKNDAFEGVPVSKILYSTTEAFRTLLVERFPAFRFALCRYPWIYWLWWPYCDYTLEKIGSAELQPDGSFSETVWVSVCDRDVPDLWFVVRQNIGGTERTVYKRYPVVCNTYWNHPGGTPVRLVVTDPKAVACSDDPATDLDPAGLWVVPLAVGNYSLKRIYGTGAGTLPASNAAPLTGRYESIGTGLSGSLGTFYAGPFGGRIGLRLLFSTALEDAGVRYYRVKYRVNGAGNWTALTERVVRHYSDYDSVTDTLNFPAYDLGPRPVGTESALFEIPPIDPPNLAGDPTAHWVVINAKVDLMNGYLDTEDLPHGYVDFKLELFDDGGVRVDPASFGGGIAFKLPANNDIWNTVTTADPASVNPDLLVADPELPSFRTFMFRLTVDNRQPTAEIAEPVAMGSGNGTDECGMTRYEATDTYVRMEYTARHPMRFANYRFRIYKAASLLHTETGQVSSSGTFTADATASLLSNLMDGCPEAAFSENLYIWNMAFNGWSRVGPDASATRAFALTPPRT